ncbi:hypothetical protein B0H19DRAFT_1069289 [Mycena capillaripes]|nr:hypothetical protein B0H19DRAFT_1069289 [Mycena capillaripes]
MHKALQAFFDGFLHNLIFSALAKPYELFQPLEHDLAVLATGNATSLYDSDGITQFQCAGNASAAPFTENTIEAWLLWLESPVPGRLFRDVYSVDLLLSMGIHVGSAHNQARLARKQVSRPSVTRRSAHAYD